MRTTGQTSITMLAALSRMSSILSAKPGPAARTSMPAPSGSRKVPAMAHATAIGASVRAVPQSAGSSFTVHRVVMSVVLAAAAGATPAPPSRTEPVTGMVLVRVEAGDLLMGSPPSEPMRERQERQHRVHLTRAFELGRHEVTQDEWRTVMGTAPSAHADCGRCPVENVDLAEVEEFLLRLDALSPLDGFRLPTEAEWERACRAGTTTAFAAGPTLGAADANVDGSWPYPGSPRGVDRGTTTPVESFAPNDWGFFDMHGNVWEWVADWHCPYPEGPVADPVGTCASDLRVIRGGSWAFGADSARCALRYTHRPRDRGPSLGFRVARDVEGPAAPTEGSVDLGSARGGGPGVDALRRGDSGYRGTPAGALGPASVPACRASRTARKQAASSCRSVSASEPPRKASRKADGSPHTVWSSPR